MARVLTEPRRDSLPNGLVLIAECMPNLRSVALGVWLKKGSRHESKEQNGISHFIEHLLFKGTETRTARDIALTIDSVGGQMDAFTTKEFTCFYFKVLDEHVNVAIDLLADIVCHPKFLPDEVEKERKVIFEEIKMVDDTPDELVYDMFSGTFYKDHPLGRPIQGTLATVARMGLEDLRRFFRESYQPGNLLVTAAGNLDHERLSRAIREAFEPLENGAPPPRSTPPRTRADIVVREKKELEQLHVCLGVPGLPLPDARRFSVHVLNTVLGGTMSSRLFQNIREQRGLAYSVFSTVNSFLDTGNLMVSAATSPESGREVIDLILRDLRRLKDEPVSDRELQLARDQLKGSLMLSLESSTSRMSNLARQEVYFGHQFNLNDILEGIDRVTQEDVLGLAQDLFDPRACTLAVLGKTAGLRIDSIDLAL
ncbi:MAG: M16 family metallopeptidase [Acidobacteriota bacterium]